MKNKKREVRKQNLTELIVGLAIIFVVNFIAASYFFRLDLTQEKRYTLSQTTKELIRKIDDVVYIRVYLEGEFPAGFKRLRNETREMLNQFRAYSNYIEFEFIDPSTNKDKNARNDTYKQLMDDGLEPTQLQVNEDKGGTSQQIVFPGAIVTYHNRKVPVQLLQAQINVQPDQVLNNSIQQLEYQFAFAIRKLIEPAKMKVAFIEGHGELDEYETADITKELKEFYVVDRITLNGQLNALKGYKCIIIAKPDSAYNEKDKFIIDQFIMKGGKVLWCIDRVVAEMDSLRANDQTVTIPLDANLDDMLFRYGARVNPNLIQDMQALPIPIVTGYLGKQPQTQFMPWYYFPCANPFGEHPIVKNMNAVLFQFASTVDTVSVKEVKKTFLLKSSKFSKVVPSPGGISLDIMKKQPDERTFKMKFLPMAVLLEGTFTSAYKNRLLDTLAKSKEINFVDKSKFNRMIVVGDGDVIRNQVKWNGEKMTVFPLGYDRFTQETFGNKNFILNAIDYLCDDSGLIEVRNREVKMRPLDRQQIKNTTYWQMINIALPALLVALFGIFHNYMRGRKFRVHP
ncbi:MAG: gliding motility-associated ABC transporter substrate-binding protein GldG [Bacteroidota bacterium]